MARRTFGREFKLEAVKLARDRGVWASVIASARSDGARRDVSAEGVDCGLHRIEGIMQAQALCVRPRGRGLPKGQGAVPAGRRTEGSGSCVPCHRPNQKWIADFTCIWTAVGWLCVAAVVDRRRENDPPDRFLILFHLAARR